MGDPTKFNYIWEYNLFNFALSMLFISEIIIFVCCILQSNMMGTEYPIEIVRQVKKYIHNKNTYLQSEIDNKYTPKRTTPLSYSEREYVEKLKSQLRDEAPIDKLLEFLESKENQWGEPDPLDIHDNLSEEVV